MSQVRYTHNSNATSTIFIYVNKKVHQISNKYKMKILSNQSFIKSTHLYFWHRVLLLQSKWGKIFFIVGLLGNFFAALLYLIKSVTKVLPTYIPFEIDCVSTQASKIPFINHNEQILQPLKNYISTYLLTYWIENLLFLLPLCSRLLIKIEFCR